MPGFQAEVPPVNVAPFWTVEGIVGRKKHLRVIRTLVGPALSIARSELSVEVTHSGIIRRQDNLRRILGRPLPCTHLFISCSLKHVDKEGEFAPGGPLRKHKGSAF